VGTNPNHVAAALKRDLPAFASGRLLDAKQVAELLGVRPRRIYGWVDQGLLPYLRVGRRLIRFTAADLDEFYRRSAEVAP
jgi:excisionase family DNA binding protein